jgi:exosortase A-associated hydrolase 2
MVAVQARRLAERGVPVLILDLTGSGDSSGDFSDARWDLWLEDVALGLTWLQTQAPVPRLLWGLRLGALLALEAARRSHVRGLVMWQAIPSGRDHLTQLLRIRVAGEMLSGARTGVETLRRTLADGTPVEIGGYEIHPALAAALDDRTLATLSVPNLPVCWLTIAADASRPLPSSSQEAVKALGRAGMLVSSEVVEGPEFWNWKAADIVECPALLAPTERFVDSVLGAP